MKPLFACIKAPAMITFIFIIFSVGCQKKAAEEQTIVIPEAMIQSQNDLLSRSLQNNHPDSIIGLYVDAPTYLAEYKTAIFSKPQLKKFYQLWLDSTAVLQYRKETYEVQAVGTDWIETGTFSMDFRKVTDTVRTYTGKYMVLWTAGNEGQLLIKSEIFGSDQYISAADVPYAHVQVTDATSRKPDASEELYAEVIRLNEGVIKAVETGDAAARAAGFTPDGIYMPHFHKMIVGMDSIRPYMFQTYNPNASLYVSHEYFDIYALGEYVLINGHFKGGWGDTITGGTFEGNMSNLRKRTADGQLLMYRQLVINDR